MINKRKLVKTVFADVNNKIKRKNKILFTRGSESLQELRNLICEQQHLTIVLWAFDCLQIPISQLKEKYPQEDTFHLAYDLCIAWAHGKIKMPIAQKAILSCHGIAKKLDDNYYIALCHAVGQGMASVHVETHALGLVFYELTAIVIKCGYINYEKDVVAKIDFYIKKLKWWQENILKYYENEEWADFLIRPNAVNKEKLLKE